MGMMHNFFAAFKGRKASMANDKVQMVTESEAPMAPMAPSADQAPMAMRSEPQPPPAPAMNPLTVVELFQSQGCSSCPPANHHVLKLVEDPNMLVLTYEVTYWDHLGWKDTFGRGEFDRRQWAYANELGKKNVFTPQVIANGQISGVGASAKDLQSILQKARGLEASSPVEIDYNASTRSVRISGSSGQRGTVNLVQYDPKWYEVPIGRGENGGRTLPHTNVVQRVTSLGKWSGGNQEFNVPALDDARLKTAILVQRGDAGSVLGAARL